MLIWADITRCLYWTLTPKRIICVLLEPKTFLIKHIMGMLIIQFVLFSLNIWRRRSVLKFDQMYPIKCLFRGACWSNFLSEHIHVSKAHLPNDPMIQFDQNVIKNAGWIFIFKIDNTMCVYLTLTTTRVT